MINPSIQALALLQVILSFVLASNQYAFMCVCVSSMCISVYICMYTHTHMYIYICIYVDSMAWTLAMFTGLERQQQTSLHARTKQQADPQP